MTKGVKRDYKKYIEFPPSLAGALFKFNLFKYDFFNSKKYFVKGYQWKNKLRYVRIYSDTPTMDTVTKDRAAKFVDMLSAIGGTMGLLTGFSIISGVEIFYFLLKFCFSLLRKRKKTIE